jgi:hypothetical protein
MVSTAEINRLGQALKGGNLSVDQLGLLYTLRERWFVLRRQIEQELEECTAQFSVTISTRVKNTATLQDKLRRLDGGLSTIRDVVGGRVVVQGDRFTQVEVLLAVIERFKDDEFRFIDRLSDPRCGYRALHLQIKRGGVRAEIQIRTQWQHDWAMAMDSFSDVAGRQVKYIDEFEFTHLPGDKKKLAQLCLTTLMKWSNEINRLERSRYPDSFLPFVVMAREEFNSRFGEFNAEL